MGQQFVLYGLLLAVAALSSASVAGVAWRHRRERGGLAFTALMAGAGTWAVGNALQVTATELGPKLLWRTVGYVGHNAVPVAILVFALEYTGYRRWVSRRTVALLALEPAVVAFVVTPTNALGLHGLLWRHVELAAVDGVVVLSRAYGPWYWFNTAYNYTLVLVALFLLLRMAGDVRGTARMQCVALVGGCLPPLAANVAWIARLTAVDYTPVVFTVTGVSFSLALYRYELLDLTPVARDTVLDAMHDGYFVLDTDGRIVDCNAAARGLVDADGSVVGRPIAAALPAVSSLAERHELGSPLREEVLVERGGEPRYFAVRVSPLDGADAPDRRVGRYRPDGRLVFLRDVTDRRAVEHRYRSLIEGSSDLIAVIRRDGTFAYLSPSAERVLGFDPADLAGDPVFEYVHPDDRGDVREAFDRCVAESGAEVSAEYRVRRADGAWVHIESRARNLLDDPLVEGVVVNSRDVSDRARRQRALEAQNERLDRFASVVSHDLRNPLNVIQGHARLARETGETAHLDAVERAADRMESLIDDLLTLARRGKTIHDTATVDLREVIAVAWSNVDTSGATLTVADDVDGFAVVADGERLSELLENLFRNSVEHGSTSSRTESDDSVEHASTNSRAEPGDPVEHGSAGDRPSPGDAADRDPANGRSAPDADAEHEPAPGRTPVVDGVHVRVGRLADGLYVEDDGPGIPPDEREAVFEHGYSSDPDGTGLGLSIVEEIATAHGWEVAATAAASGGARFEVTGVERPTDDG